MVYYGRPKGKMECFGNAFLILCVVLLFMVLVMGIILHQGGGGALRNIVQPDDSPFSLRKIK